MRSLSNVTGTFEYELEPSDGGTDVTFTCDVRPHGSCGCCFLAAAFEPVSYVDQLQRLKRAAERAA